MPRYEISGTTAEGNKIKEVFEAVSAKRALVECIRIYGKLKRGYQVVKLIEDYDLPEYEKPKHSISYDNEIDQEILRFYQRIKANVITQKGYNHFQEDLIGPIVKKAIKDLWKELDNVATKEEIEQELIEDVIKEFLPRYKPEKGPLLRFLRLNVRNRVRKKWSREVYVNPENPNKKRPRKEALKELEFMEYIKVRGISDDLDVEIALEKVKSLVTAMLEHNNKLPGIVRKCLFSLIAKTGLHREILKRRNQLEVFELYYGKSQLNEREIAEIKRRTQQTIHRNKRRAEINVLKQIL